MSMDRERLRKTVESHEGRRNRVYYDTRGIPTIGVGFNLMRDDALDLLAALGYSYEAVLHGHEISDLAIDELFGRTLDEAIATAKHVIGPAFDSLPDDVQILLVDLAFNLGGKRLSGFVRFIAAVCVHDWAGAAYELQHSRWYGQVGRRAIEAVELLQEQEG